MLHSIGNGFGRYLNGDNAIACVTCPEAVRICIELDVSQLLRKSFWLGPSGIATSHFQEVIFNSTPSICVFCRKQSHFEAKCSRCDRIVVDKKKKKVLE